LFSANPSSDVLQRSAAYQQMLSAAHNGHILLGRQQMPPRLSPELLILM
jgi:hypothetical protein